MKLLLPYFIILIVVIQLKLRKSTKNNKERMSKFWEKELSANSVRKKDISNLNYITIPDSLPTININDTKILKDYETINKLRERKILNLSGMSNTNIKLEYGVDNQSEQVEELSEEELDRLANMILDELLNEASDDK